MPTDPTPDPAAHDSDGLWGWVSMRCEYGVDGCDDRACVCRCHNDNRKATEITETKEN